jgi:serine protein kinase
MFKAPIKVLNPMLDATQGGNYKATEGIGALPWSGVICAHSNEKEWDEFRNNKTNEAFIDRIFLVRVPYCLRLDEEENIYKKLLRESDLHDAPCAHETLRMLATWSLATRYLEPQNSNIWSKMRVYNGDIIKDTDPQAKSYTEYRASAGIQEGMSGMSTRFAFKILSRTFSADPEEIAANPVHLMSVLVTAIEQENLPADMTDKYKNYIREKIQVEYLNKLEKELQQAYLESYGDYGQNLFDRYFLYADAWIQDADFRDPDTHQMWDRDQLNSECEKIEKAAGIANPKDFRNEIVNYVLRYRAKNQDQNPKWTEYEKLKEVIEKRIFTNTEEILPIIAFGKKGSTEDQTKHQNFVDRMIAAGYTERQVRILVDWFIKTKKSG